jgi:hypothetical protein
MPKSRHEKYQLKKAEDTLKAHGVSYQTSSTGHMLIVAHKGLVADFWPQTEAYTIYGKGMENLLRQLGIEVNPL